MFAFAFLLARIAISVSYFLTKSVYFLPTTKILQIFSLYTQRNGMSIVALVVEYAASLFMTARKEKRNLNFDSRLESKYLAGKISAVYLLVLVTYLTDMNEISKNPSAVLFCSLIYYSLACLDPLYSYRTRQVLKSMALVPVFMSVYFLLLPFVPALNDFNLVAHHILSSLIFLAMIFYAN